MAAGMLSSMITTGLRMLLETIPVVYEESF
jgi:hypothetical protein